MNEQARPNADDVDVVDNAAEGRFEARLDGKVAGFSTYRLVADRLVFLHTEVDPAYEGRGIGSRLVRGALDDVRSRGLRATPRCPFVADYIERHPEYRDLTVS